MALLLAFCVPWAHGQTTPPFDDNFEGATSNWTFVNGSLTNQWSIGSATNNGGSKSMYLSNDGGTSNAYSTGSSTVVYAYKEFTLAAGQYEISYDWNCKGESTWDFIRVVLTPSTETLTAGTTLLSGLSATAVPSTWTALDGGTKLNLASSWQSYSGDFTVTTAGTYKIAFCWRNDGSDGTQPPAAIDNFYMRKASTSTSYSYNDILWVGIVQDPSDLNDLQIVGYGLSSTTTYDKQIVTFSNYTGGTTGYIVFLAAVDQNATATYKYASFYVDDLRILNPYDSVSVVATAQVSNTGTVEGSGRYLRGTEVTLTATPAEHFHFVQWVEDGVTTPTRTITATFAKNEYTVTLVADPDSLGTVTGDGTYNYLDTVMVVATPDSGYYFRGWSNGETDDTLYIVLTSDTNLTATFTEISTSVGDVEASDYVAYTEGRRIIVTGVEGRTISLFDATGRLVATRTDANETETFDTPLAGVYMIKVNGMNTTAIVVK